MSSYRIKKSDIDKKGRGLYATKDIKEGTRIIDYIGKLITKKQSLDIAVSAKKILRRAIEVGGTTLKDFYQPDGNQGYFKIELSAYDREGQECVRCKAGIIQRIVQTQRASFFCSKCQS